MKGRRLREGCRDCKGPFEGFNRNGLCRDCYDDRRIDAAIEARMEKDRDDAVDTYYEGELIDGE